MIIDLDKKERDLLVHELEETTIPQIRELVASGMRKNNRDELKTDEEALKNVLEKLKKAA
jgi:FMN-dependent NADH-azoreductase